jgi:hypothetical protein
MSAWKSGDRRADVSCPGSVSIHRRGSGGCGKGPTDTLKAIQGFESGIDTDFPDLRPALGFQRFFPFPAETSYDDYLSLIGLREDGWSRSSVGQELS